MPATEESWLRQRVGWIVLAGTVVLVNPSFARAEMLKLDIKVSAGMSSTTFVDMLETGRERDTFFGWQIGVGARLRENLWFVESLLSFNRWALRASVDDISVKGRVNAFELPLIAGIVPYKNPYFHLYIYGGFVNHFNTRLVAKVSNTEGEQVTVKLRPKEVDLAIYQALARFGLAFDIAMFNVDFNYSISMNSATQTPQRTGYHQLQLNIGYLF